MKKLILTLIFTLSYNSMAIDKVIYSEDDRFEVSSIQAYYFQKQSKSVAGMIEKDRLWSKGDSYFYEYLSLQSAGFPSMPFYHQQLLTECTGFLIAEKTLATAAHCVSEMKKCDDVFWTFNYTKETSRLGVFHRNELYECSEIITIQKDVEKGLDFALIKLKRAPLGISPLKSSKESSLQVDDEVVMIGHPLGLPKKLTKNAVVTNIDNPLYFSAYIDAFSGNSGSPVFNAKTGLLEGLLFRGAQDFEELPDGTEVVNICDFNYEDCGQGEDIQRISEVLKYLPAN